MKNKYDKQGRSIAETIFGVEFQDKQISEGQKLSDVAGLAPKL